MRTKLPPAVPQIPVNDLDLAIEFYRSRLGFSLDWKSEDGIAGVSRDETRLFLDRMFEGPLHPVRVWINLDSILEVEGLYREWLGAGVSIATPPEKKPWGLYEFIAQDPDGNSYRAFHDVGTTKAKGR